MSTAEHIRGFGFPFRIDPRTGGVGSESGAEKIRHDILVLLATRLGERPLLRNFGTKLAALVHDPNDDVLADVISEQIRNALLQWEPRVFVTDISVKQSEGELRLFLTYTIVHSSRSERMVVPLA